MTTEKVEKYDAAETCASRMCGHPWGDHWTEGPCAIWECPCAGMVRKSDQVKPEIKRETK